MNGAEVKRAHAAVLRLLALRADQATLCPSEVARAFVEEVATGTSALSWRDAMPIVHVAVDRLLKEGSIQLLWKGKARTVRSGPYRIRRANPG